jgi:glycosyltransferase involved in cell wall biosynthesis
VALPISVVIPTFNRAHLIERSIRSALAAMAPGDELIVADDGSTDGTDVLMAKWADRLRYLKLPHGGAGPARNGGLRAAKHSLVSYLDSDDEWFPDILELQRTVMGARPDLTYVFSDFAVQDEQGVLHRRYLPRWQERPRPLAEVLGPGAAYSTFGALPPGRADFPVHIGDLYPAELDDNFVATFTFCVRRGTAHDDLEFVEDLPFCEDWEYFARLAKAGPVAFLDTETATQHGHGGPRLTKTDPYVIAGARIRMIERLWGLDEAFLANHRDAYDATIARLRVVRAKRCLKRGEVKAARAELRAAKRAPLTLKALALLPGPLVRLALSVLTDGA